MKYQNTMLAIATPYNVSGVGEVNELKNLLGELKNDVIDKIYPNVPNDQHILRNEIINILASNQATNGDEWRAAIPQEYRKNIHVTHMEFLPEVFNLIKAYKEDFAFVDYWEKKSGKPQFLNMVKIFYNKIQSFETSAKLSYQEKVISLASGENKKSFMIFRPNDQHDMTISIRFPHSTHIEKMLNKENCHFMNYLTQHEFYRFSINESNCKECLEHLIPLIVHSCSYTKTFYQNYCWMK